MPRRLPGRIFDFPGHLCARVFGMNNLGIYVQVPFCQTKCTYCNFHTGVEASSRFAPYVEAVCSEIRRHRQLLCAAGVKLAAEQGGAQDRLYHPDTVYIGGGTPSLLQPNDLVKILGAIRETFPGELSEVTLEADPETIEPGKAGEWAKSGINRISLGLQSFADQELIASGRMHRRADIYHAVPILRAAGIRNISFDLIAGLPKQTRESWKRSLSELITLAPEHVSIYLLEIDEGSRLGKELLEGGKRYSAGTVPSEDEMAEFYEMGQSALSASGYQHYEISNWAKPGYASRHNLKYWQRAPYLGFGAGAHSFSGTQRWANAHDAAAYVAAVENGRLPLEQLEDVTPENALEEELFLGLRKREGIDLARIEREYGAGVQERFEGLEKAGFVERSGQRVRIAEDRLSVANEVFVELMK